MARKLSPGDQDADTIWAFGCHISAIQGDKVYVIGNGLNGLYTLEQLEEHVSDPHTVRGRKRCI